MEHRIRRGFTLLEVMIALLIFSLGLIGVAGLLAVSVKSTHSAYLRTQATFLVQSMADRMRANVLGLWNDSYNTALTTSANATVPTTCNSPNTCSFTAVATRDIVIFQNQLVAFMPSTQFSIACAPNGTKPTQLLALPPYSGTCEIFVSWNDSSKNNTNQFDWVFTP